MKHPAALLNDLAYKKALRLCNTISEHRFALADLAYELRDDNYRVTTVHNGKIVCDIHWHDIIAAAEGIAVKTAQERAQVGEFCAIHNPKTTRYSRVSSAVRYCGVIDDAELVEMIDDEETYPKVEDLQAALWQVAYSKKQYKPVIINRSLKRMGNAGAALLGLSDELPDDIRPHVTRATAEIGQALEKMKARMK